MANNLRKTRNAAALSGGALVVAAPFIGAGTAAATGSIFTVTNTNGSGPDSLQAAVDAANANPDADTIVFAAGVNGTISLTHALYLQHSVDIQGPGAAVITIDGNDIAPVFYTRDSSGLADKIGRAHV